MRIPFVKKPSDQQRQTVLITLTSEGLKEAENFASEGDEFEVLAVLNQKRPQSIGSISKETQIPFNKCVDICKELKRKGFISQVQRSQ